MSLDKITARLLEELDVTAQRKLHQYKWRAAILEALKQVRSDTLEEVAKAEPCNCPRCRPGGMGAMIEQAFENGVCCVCHTTIDADGLCKCFRDMALDTQYQGQAKEEK